VVSFVTPVFSLLVVGCGGEAIASSNAGGLVRPASASFKTCLSTRGRLPGGYCRLGYASMHALARIVSAYERVNVCDREL
jgi:hypothetical protein